MLRIYDHYIDIIYEYFNIFEICNTHSTNTRHTHTRTHIHAYTKHTMNIIFKGNANLNKNL